MNHAKGSSAGFLGGKRATLLAFLGLAIFAAALTASPASADEIPTGTVGTASSVSYASAHLTGTVNPFERLTYYGFEYSTDQVNWTRGPQAYFAGNPTVGPNSGPTEVSEDLTGLKGGTEYFVRLGTYDEVEFTEHFSPAPYLSFTTLPVEAPTAISVADASSVAYTTAKAAGEIERPANADPAFDAHCRFEYVSDQQFTENQANSAPLFEGAGVAPCEPAAAEKTPGKSPVTANLSGLTVGTTYHLRLAVSNAGGADSKEAADTFTTLSPGAATVSIDPVTTFTATTAHFSGHITPGGTDPAFDVNWEFHCTPECPGLAGGHITADTGSHEVHADATGLEPHITYEVKLIATNAGGPESAGPQSFQTTAVVPVVETLPAFVLGDGTEALVGGRVNPKNSPTKYWVEYGADSSYGTSIPASRDASAGSGGELVILTQKITGLTPSTEYHFRLVAENAKGEIQGHDVNFETAAAGPAPESCLNATLRSENNSTELPDCRAYEQVSPVDKNGYDAGTVSTLPGYVAAEDGSALSFESYGAFADPVGGSAINSYLSRRGGSGWTTQELSPPVSSESASADFPVFQYFTPDMKYAVVHAPTHLLLAPGATPNAINLYLRDNSTGTYRTLNLGTGPGSGPESGVTVAAASADGEHILFESNAALTADAPPGANDNLYEWSDGQLHLVTIGPGGTPMPGGGWIEAATFTSVTMHAISEDGSRAVFKSLEEENPGQLYLYEDGQPTVKVSASHRSPPDPGGPGYIRFLGASADTSRIYFTDTEALTDDATPGDPTLYRYDADTKSLINLEADLGAGAELTEGIGAISEDGSYVYFRTNSELYLWHNGTNTLVGVVPGNLAELEAYYTTYRVTGDGRYLTFQTPYRLTAYDNTDALTGEPDSEVYLYDAALQRLTCVSCNPDGLPPHGLSSFPGPPKRPQRNLQPGASEDGTVFFDSSDALVPNDVNGKEDVYEWRNGRAYLISSGTSGDPSFYASASKSGDDVFFATREPLVAGDRDQLLDVYDASVRGGFPQRAQASPPCEGAEACHGSASSAPGFADPATAALSGAPSPSPRARRLKAALEACRHKPTKARAKCRSKARKRFTKAGRAH